MDGHQRTPDTSKWTAANPGYSGGLSPRTTTWEHLSAQQTPDCKYSINCDHRSFQPLCAAKHSLDYSSLPDWFVVFDVYDRSQQRFFSNERRNQLAQQLGLATVPAVFAGKTSLNNLKQLLASAQSRYRVGPPEGLIIRQQSEQWCGQRAKLVRADFTQTIEEHWSSRGLEWNQINTKNSLSHQGPREVPR